MSILLILNILINTKKFSKKYFMRFRWKFGTFDFIPVNFIEFLIKIFTVLLLIFFLCVLLHFCFHVSLVMKKHNRKMITNIYFKNCSFKIGINKKIVIIGSIAVAVFLVTLVGLFFIEIMLFWYNKFRKFCTFLQLSRSNTLRLKSPAI